MKKIIEKRNYIILFIIIVLILFIIFGQTKTKEYMESFNYFNETITIKIYENKNMDKTFKKIDQIYKEYHKYYQKPQTASKELIEYGKTLYQKTNGLIDITTNELITKIENNEDYEFTSSINQIDYNNKETLTNLNFDSIIASYATTEVEKYLENQNIKKYLISEDGNIIAGKHYNDKKYKISITNDQGTLVDIAYLQNASMVTKGNVNTFKPYMVNPVLSKKHPDNKLVVVISKNLNEANSIANALYLLTLEEGQEYIKEYKAEALWQTNNTNYTTKNFKKYLKN